MIHGPKTHWHCLWISGAIHTVLTSTTLMLRLLFMPHWHESDMCNQILALRVCRFWHVHQTQQPTIIYHNVMEEYGRSVDVGRSQDLPNSGAVFAPGWTPGFAASDPTAQWRRVNPNSMIQKYPKSEDIGITSANCSFKLRWKSMECRFF